MHFFVLLFGWVLDLALGRVLFWKLSVTVQICWRLSKKEGFVVVVTEAVMMRPSLLFLVVLLAAGKPCVCVCVCGRGPTLFRALFPFVSHWTDANSRDSLGFFRQWFVCMCYLRGCVFVVDLLDVSVEMRGVSEQGLHLVIRRSFVSDWCL